MSITQEQKSFIKKVGALAAGDMLKSSVLASLTIAQAILESSWGKSGLTVKANALFGIKAGSSWKGKVYSTDTKECYNGVSFTTVTALFRAYDSWEESVADHSALLNGAARYKDVIGENDYKKACRAIQAAGYSTDPAYAEKLISIIEAYCLHEYDAAADIKTTAKETGKMTSLELIAKLQNIAGNLKTVYMWGVFGSPVTEAVVAGKSKQYPSWYTAAKQAELRKLIGKGYFAFDCVNLIKSVLWGWNGDASKSYGGAAYNTNGVPDISADTMITKCTGVSTDFSNITPGEAVWLPGHIGLYIGSGKVIECTPSWNNSVQVTACLNIGAIAGLNGRRWTKHGKLPYITYDSAGTKGDDEVLSTMKVQVDGGEVKTIGSILKDGQNYPNLRELAALTGYGVGYEANTKVVTLTRK